MAFEGAGIFWDVRTSANSLLDINDVKFIDNVAKEFSGALAIVLETNEYVHIDLSSVSFLNNSVECMDINGLCMSDHLGMINVRSFYENEFIFEFIETDSVGNELNGFRSFPVEIEIGI